MKLSTAQMLDNLAFYQEIVDNVPACIFINELFHVDGRPILRNVWGNRFAHQFIGYSREEINQMGVSFFKAVMHPDDLKMVDSDFNHLNSINVSNTNLHRLKTKNSSTYSWLYGYSTVIASFDDGTPKKFLNISIEIGKQIGTENQLYCLIKEANHLRNQWLTQKLTPRQKEILGLIARGKRDKEIAKLLFISPATAKTHRNMLIKKLNLKNTATLAAFAVECGL
jgi:DNA-binding CsgD family transcriptional regulator